MIASTFLDIQHPPIPYSEANDLFDHLLPLFREQTNILEIGSGTGQHACHFSSLLPESIWQPSELADKLPSLKQEIERKNLSNCLSPIVLDVMNPQHWPHRKYSSIFTANTVQELSWMEVIQMFQGISHCLAPGGLFALYGALHHQNSLDSSLPLQETNFELSLKGYHLRGTLKDSKVLHALAEDCWLKPYAHFPLEAHHHLLIWEKER